MTGSMFHIFRNNPLGRENLLQACDFCQRLGDLTLHVYRPRFAQLVIYLDDQLLSISLDSSYLADPDTSLHHLRQILQPTGLAFIDRQPDSFTASTVPDFQGSFTFMSCPRVISQDTARIGLGHLGPKVRTLVKHAPFPLFIPCGARKPWHSVAGFFGGSDLGLQAVRLAAEIADAADLPLNIFTQANDADLDLCRRQLDRADLLRRIENESRFQWTCFHHGRLQDNLLAVPFDSLVICGAAGRSVIRELVFGSTMELLQSQLPNPLLVVGPNFRGLHHAGTTQAQP